LRRDFPVTVFDPGRPTIPGIFSAPFGKDSLQKRKRGGILSRYYLAGRERRRDADAARACGPPLRADNEGGGRPQKERV